MSKWTNPNRFNKRTNSFNKRNPPIFKNANQPIQVLVNEIIDKKEINTIEKLINYININKTLENTIIYDLNLLEQTKKIIGIKVEFACFFGCKMDTLLIKYITNNKGIVYPSITGIIPLNIYKSQLYNPYELLSGYYNSLPNVSLDDKIYEWYEKYKKIDDEKNMLSQFAMNTHDAFIDDALISLIKNIGKEKIIGVMGGHSNKRNSIEYKILVKTCRLLTLNGFICMSGGSSGMMEAVHLGALLAYYPEESVDDAINILSQEINYTDLVKYYNPAINVLNKYPMPKDKVLSIAIPTWNYYEPTAIFASHIAEYFSNPIREYNLLNFSYGGVLISPGSAGTMAEVFINHANQHYKTLGYNAPFVFQNKYWWTTKNPIFPVISQIANTQNYKSRLFLVETPEEVVNSFKIGPI